MYKCMYCGKRIEMDIKKAKKIICPSCGYRILLKERPAVTRKVVSR
jgi:DNA-directed RNA polymerase subunit RPC12/RpoP